MNINDLNPRTVAVLDIKLNQKPYSGSGMANSEEHHYITHMQYNDRKGKLIVEIPYQAEQLLEQATYLIRLANHCIENNTNIQYP
ncbi:MAG: hypothetical protein QG594_743 [Bacteroidota bacterium]|nr:hypothetical protein [Bacteroidota bacterium]